MCDMPSLYQCKCVDNTNFTPTVHTAFVDTTKKSNKHKPQNTRENYEVIVISINKIWTWTAEVT